MSFLVHHILPDMNHRIVAMSSTTDGVQLVEQLLLTLFSNFVLKGLVLLILFNCVYALLPMPIVCVFIFSLFTIIFAVFLQIKMFN